MPRSARYGFYGRYGKDGDVSMTYRTDMKSANPLPVHSNANLPLVHGGKLVGGGRWEVVAPAELILGSIRGMERTMAYNFML